MSRKFRAENDKFLVVLEDGYPVEPDNEPPYESFEFFFYDKRESEDTEYRNPDDSTYDTADAEYVSDEEAQTMADRLLTGVTEAVSKSFEGRTILPEAIRIASRL